MLTKIFSVYTILFVKSMYMLLLHLVRCLSTSNYKLPTKFPRPFLYSYLPIRLQRSLYNYKLHRTPVHDSSFGMVGFSSVVGESGDPGGKRMRSTDFTSSR